MRARRPVFIGHKGAAFFRGDAEHVKVVAGNNLCEKLLCLAAGAAQAYLRECVPGDIRKRFVLITIVEEIKMRCRKWPGILDVSRENRDKLIGALHRKRRKQKRADDAEDGSIGSDTQSE